MRTGRLHARRDQLAPPRSLGRIVVIFPASWSPERQVAYDAAGLAGDPGQQAALKAQESGAVVDRGPA